MAANDWQNNINDAKVKLYLALLTAPVDEEGVSDSDVDLLYMLSNDPHIQSLLKKKH